MNKKSIEESLVSSGILPTKAAAERVVDHIINDIRSGVKDGKKVSIAGLGIFIKQKMDGRTGRNPRTGEKIEVPSYFKIKFFPTKSFKVEVQ